MGQTNQTIQTTNHPCHCTVRLDKTRVVLTLFAFHSGCDAVTLGDKNMWCFPQVFSCHQTKPIHHALLNFAKLTLNNILWKKMFCFLPDNLVHFPMYFSVESKICSFLPCLTSQFVSTCTPTLTCKYSQNNSLKPNVRRTDNLSNFFCAFHDSGIIVPESCTLRNLSRCVSVWTSNLSSCLWPFCPGHNHHSRHIAASS